MKAHINYIQLGKENTLQKLKIKWAHIFSDKDYYQFPVGNRTLYARTLEDLILLRNYFQENCTSKKGGYAELDFPKLFYVKREEIVKKIDLILKEDTSSR